MRGHKILINAFVAFLEKTITLSSEFPSIQKAGWLQFFFANQAADLLSSERIYVYTYAL